VRDAVARALHDDVERADALLEQGKAPYNVAELLDCAQLPVKRLLRHLPDQQEGGRRAEVVAARLTGLYTQWDGSKGERER